MKLMSCLVSNDDLLVESIENNQNCSSSTLTVNEDTWRQFCVPWQKLPETTLKDLEAGERNKNLIKIVTHMIVNEMRVLKRDLTAKTFKIIAHKIIDRFPKSFKDIDDDGVVLGDGSHSLVRKLEERNSYLNACLKRKDNADTKPLVKHQKKRLAAKAGCVNWNPQPMNSENSQIVNIKQAVLNDSLKAVFLETYPTQRVFLNQSDPPSIAKIKEEWPVLLSELGIKWHFEKLMNSNVDELENMLKEKSRKLINFGILKKKIKSTIDFNGSASEEEICIEALRVVASVLKEDIGEFLYTLIDKQKLEDAVKTLNPCIVCKNDEDNTRKVYYVVIEKEIINEGTACFFDALKQCYACFYNLNMQYPKKISATLEFIQRYFLKCHPDAGTKSQVHSLSKKKVINIMKNLADFDMDNTQ